MTIVMTDDGEKTALENVLGSENVIYKLFTNNISPEEATVLGDFTEAAGFGYASQTVLTGDWTITKGDPTVAVTAAPLVFSFTGALGNVYGFFVVGASSGKLRWAERFTDGPYSITTNGQSITVTPYLSTEKL